MNADPQAQMVPSSKKCFRYYDLIMVAFVTPNVLWEVLATPLTYKVVGFLKKKENEDYFDKDTNFRPFSIST